MHRACITTAAVSLTAYVLMGLVLPVWFRAPRGYFGFNQLKHVGVTGTVVLVGLGVAAILLYRARRQALHDLVGRCSSALFSNRLLLLIVAVAAAVVFFLLRSNFLNQDSIDLTWKLPADVPLKGAHVTHDEMWELYLHSRFWYYTNRFFGWDVTLSYQVLSCVAGGVFVWLLALYARLLDPGKALALAALVGTGGFLQLFFGDPENYTLTAVLVLAYLYASAAFLRGRCSVVWPGVLLATAMTFHLLAGWLLPSLAYLFLIELRRRRYGPIVIAVGAMAAILWLTLWFFHLHGLPLRNLYFHSHAFGHGGDILSMLARPSPRRYLGLLNLLFLLAPAVWLLPALVGFRRIRTSPIHVHLMLASTFLLVFMFSWKTMLGIYRDWNLFAIGAIPLSVLIWSSLLDVESLRRRGDVLLALFWIFSMHSYSWIVWNHFLG